MSAATGTPLPAHWDYYLRRSREADTGRADDFGSGRDEQLWETLLAIERGERFAAATLRRLDRVPWNRAKKHRRLREELAAGLRPPRHGEGPQVDEAVTRDSVGDVRRLLLPDQWTVEWRLALSEKLADIAAEHNLPVGTLKVRVMRWRNKIRGRRASPDHSPVIPTSW